MSAEILEFTGVTSLDLDPDRVIDRAAGKLKSVIIIGYDHDGDEFFASSVADGGEVLWLLERTKLKLLRVADRDQQA
jgi:hypothetical protein